MKTIVCLLVLVFNTCLLAQNRYQPDWESLKKHTDPEWFRDAKYGSERAIRNVKVKQKISGQFKILSAAENFAILRCIIETAIKNNQNVLQALNVIADYKRR